MNHTKPTSAQPGASSTAEILRGLVTTAARLVVSELDAFTGRLSNALLACSEQSLDARLANQSFTAGQLLKKNSYAYFHLASERIARELRQETEQLLNADAAKSKKPQQAEDEDFSLVSYEEMDKSLALARVSRAIELHHAEEYTALNMRLSHLLQREALSIAQNPFRPDAFLNGILRAWCEFEPDQSAHELLLPLLSPELLFDLGPVLEEVNLVLIKHGILPDLQESYRIRRSREKRQERQEQQATAETAQQLMQDAQNGDEPAQKLRQFLSPSPGRGFSADHGSPAVAAHEHVDSAAFDPSSSAMWQQLADWQKSFRFQHLVNETGELLRLSQLQEQMAANAGHGPGTRVEQRTLSLLSQVFDSVFRNETIPAPVKQLISLLQIPVLKAALLDKEFFFQEDHPARRLVDLLSRYSLSVDQQQGNSDPLLQRMKSNVERVSQEFDRELSLFEEVINDLEAFMLDEEKARAETLQAPIQRALRKEKIKQANVTANHEVALRVGSGEVIAFVETFLENRWVKVLTLAYTLKEEKPHVIADAIRTMDDLIWSVKPKISLQERQDLLNRLPAILARLNKWLSLIKWNDADRVQFFAELAECHASIVRAPLELTPDKQLEIAVEAAQQAAERRLEKRAEAEKKAQQQAIEEAEASDDPVVALVDGLERGIWIALQMPDMPPVKVRLAWVSPMRSLYIFTSSQKEQSFSIPVKELQQAFRDQKASILDLDKVVDRALIEAVDSLHNAEAGNGNGDTVPDASAGTDTLDSPAAA